MENKEDAPEVTLEELQAQVEELTKTNNRYKESIDKLTHKNSEQQKQLRAKMTADEQTKEEQRVAQEALSQLKRDNAILKSTISLSRDGFSAEEAKKIAEYTVDGDVENMLSAVTAHLKAKEDALEKSYKQKLAEVQRPASGNDSNNVDYGKLISDAIASGNQPEAARLIRVRAEKEG